MKTDRKSFSFRMIRANYNKQNFKAPSNSKPKCSPWLRGTETTTDRPRGRKGNPMKRQPMEAPFDEQETVIYVFPDEKTISIQTNDSWMQRKMERLCKLYPEDYKCEWRNQSIYVNEYTAPRKCLAFMAPSDNPEGYETYETGLK